MDLNTFTFNRVDDTLSPVHERPTMSVALCTYNGAEFIKDQLQSIISQTTPPDEIILSDDASIDCTVEIAQKILKSQNKINNWKILKNKNNIGYVKNFENATKACTSDIIFLSDQDDVWLPNKTDLFLTLLTDKNIDFIFSDGWVTDRDLKITNELFASFNITENEISIINSGDGFHLFLERSFATGAASVFRRQLLEEALPFPSESWHHDEWLAFLAASKSRIKALPKKTFLYRQHGRNQIGIPANSYLCGNNTLLKIFYTRLLNSINGNFPSQCRIKSEALYLTEKILSKSNVNSNILEVHKKKIIKEAEFYKLRGSALSLGWIINIPKTIKIYKNNSKNPYLALMLDAISSIFSIFNKKNK